MEDATIDKMIDAVFGSGIWHSTSLIEKIGDANSLGTMIQIGYAFAALMLIIQAVITVLNISRSSSPQIWENIGPLIFKVVIISALMSSPLYNLLFRYTISGATNLMANAIFSDYAKDFLVSWKNVFSDTGNTPSTPWEILVATFNNSLVSNILSSIIFLAAVCCVFVVSMLQPFLWLFCFYAGPICLAFAICDLTTHVAKNWLNMFLIVNFVGIFGSISFSIAQAASLVSDFGAGTAANNIILVAVYGVMSIIFFCLIWPLTAYIFSGNSNIGSLGTPQAAVSMAATGAMAYGAGMSTAGSVLTRMGSTSSIIGRMGSGMQLHGKSIMQGAENASRISSGRTPISYRKAVSPEHQQGSLHTQSSVPIIQTAHKEQNSGSQHNTSISEKRNSSIPDGN